MRKITLFLIVMVTGALVAQVYNPYPGKLVPIGGGSGTVTEVQAGTGITVTNGTTTPTVAVDSSIVRIYSIGAGAPSAPCAAGQEVYTDSTADVVYDCIATDTWKRSSGDIYAGVDSGGDDTYAPTVAGFPAAYATGQALILRVTTANTAAATININGIGAKAVKVADGSTDPATGDITAGKPAVLVYDATADSASGAWILQVAGGGSVDTSTLLKKPSTRRFALFQYIGSGTAMTGVGDVATQQGTGSASLSAADTDPSAINLVSAGTTDSRNEFVGNLMWRTGRNLSLETYVKMVETTVLTQFVGITNDNGAGSTATPQTTARYFGFRYAAASNTTWQCVQDNNTGTPNTADSAVTVDTGWHTFRVVEDTTNTRVNYYIDGTQVCAALNSTNYPGGGGTNYTMRYVVAERTLENVAKNMRVAHIYVGADR